MVTAVEHKAEDTSAVHPMWTAIYHDRDTDRLFLWYDTGRLESKVISNTFYTPYRGEFNSIPCGMRDIYGKEMYSVTCKSKVGPE